MKTNVWLENHQNHPKLQKTPSKITFEGVFLTFRAKNGLKSEKWRFALPRQSRYCRSTETRIASMTELIRRKVVVEDGKVSNGAYGFMKKSDNF